MESSTEVPVPLRVRLLFGRAAVQVVADEIGADVLHIKGNAADESLRPEEASGTDVDILVRPVHVAALDRALRGHGWRVYSTFVYGSPFGHAQTYLHDAWGYLDLHRWFPGIRSAPEVAFERMWADRQTVDFAGVACSVPSVAAQATLLVLNAARGARRGADLALSWTDASIEHRTDVEDLVDVLDAHVAFAAATGDLERFRGERDYRLWKVVSEGGGRSEEWWARVRSAPSLGEALRIAARAPLVNIEHLSIELGRSPTRREVASAFFARPRRMVAEAWVAIKRRGGRR
ncbi:hypothetical protein BH10ACT5_BH10ACT5_19020 [soil metagenome]